MSQADTAGAREPLALSGFNNLTKTVSVNLYRFTHVPDAQARRVHAERVSERYAGAALAQLLRALAEAIGAEVLSESTQDYQPHGASALTLMSDIEQATPAQPASTQVTGVGGRPMAAAHLDKSHLSAHTYPDLDDPAGIASIRVDVDLSTCGTIVPLRALPVLFDRVEFDVAVVDYKVRGFTRDTEGQRVYLDHFVGSPLDYVEPAALEPYELHAEHWPGKNTWQARLRRREPLCAQAEPKTSAQIAHQIRAVFGDR